MDHTLARVYIRNNPDEAIVKHKEDPYRSGFPGPKTSWGEDDRDAKRARE